MADRRRLFAAFAVGSSLAAAIVIASWAGDPAHRTAYGDGLIYRFVAAHIGASPEELPRFDPDRVVIDRGPSLRYGRIGLPAAVWLISGGRADLMKFTQPLVIVVAAGAASAAAAVLLPGAGIFAAAIPFLAPGFALSVAGGYAEVLAVALGLWAVAFALRDRWGAAAFMLSMAMLTKENAGAVLGGLALWLLLRRRPRPIAILTLGLVPVAAWWLFIANRFGHIPPLDPYLREATTTIGTPVISLIRSFTDAYSTESAIWVGLHVVLGVLAIALWRTSLFALIGAVASLQLLAAGPFGWRYIGDASRISSIFQLFVILAIVTWRRPAWAAPGAVPTVPREPAMRGPSRVGGEVHRDRRPEPT